MKLTAYPHGGSGNHGCEAIVRSTVKLTRSSLTLCSSQPEEDIRYGVNQICRIVPERQIISRLSTGYWQALMNHHLRKDHQAFDRLCFDPVIREAMQSDLALSIGGDNYCYGVPEYIFLINQELRKRHIPTVLWGCSVEPEAIQGRMLADLSEYTGIVARESLTFDAMQAKGLKQTVLFPDPAFVLNREDLPLPEGFMEGNTVGINVSPMIIQYEKAGGMTLQNYITLMQYIIDHTDMQIALIPHVVWSHNDDRIPLQQLYEAFKETGRVVLIGDHPAEVLKGFIARCRFMVVARTHASIAAYSEQVPTLVVGYSVKARGIAKDLFGTDQDYVLPVSALQQETDLIDGFKFLMQQEKQIHNHYAAFMPDYCGRLEKINTVL